CRRLRTDSPILAELSGGLDSSSIVCMADDILGKAIAETPSMDTFSFWDNKEPDDDDFLFFAKVEEKRGRIGHHAELRGLGDTLSFEYPQFVASPGFGERQELKAARLEKMKLGKYRVVLSGIGGDEFLGQVLDPSIQMADLLVQFRLGALARYLKAWSLLSRRPLIQLLSRTLIMLLPTSIRSRLTQAARKESWINETFARKHRLCTYRLQAADGSYFWLPSARDSMQTHAALARQMTHTRPSTEETRYPYLDQTLIEFLTSIPTDQLLRPGERRSLVRRALKNFVPPEILARHRKAGTGRCFALALEKHWASLKSVVSAPLTSPLGYVNQAEFEAAIIAARDGHVSENILRLLKTLSLELWLREAIARRVISVQIAVPKTISENIAQCAIQ
ncbi:MAG TPA: asparagine synthase C-terminal domain-containing protein, partial [Nitrososphaera sp.]|nr:asparagine synthase C-terminal domain-containing protein [Nitrososphaera sp.]